MKLFVIFISIFSVSVAQVDSPAQQLADAERSFSALSEKEGIKTSFLTFLDDSCIMFNPHPINGKQLYANRPASPAFLSWNPTFVEVAASGDFGISTGPWEYSKSKQDTVLSVGYFFSVWKKNREGNWKVALDLGVGFPKEKKKKEPEHFAELKSSGRNIVKRGAAETELLHAERSFAQSVNRLGAEKAYARHSADNLRVYRDGSFPSTNKKESEAAIKNAPQHPSYFALAADAASSGDLGFTYGYAVNAQNDSSSYVRVWRLVPSGKEKEWKIAVDILKPFKP